MTLAKLMAVQGQLMQTTKQCLQNQPAGGAQAPQAHVWDKRGKFLKGHPPMFSHAIGPMEADDWLRAVERQLNIAQCDDQQKVLYASGQLQGVALDW